MIGILAWFMIHSCLSKAAYALNTPGAGSPDRYMVAGVLIFFGWSCLVLMFFIKAVEEHVQQQREITL